MQDESRCMIIYSKEAVKEKNDSEVHNASAVMVHAKIGLLYTGDVRTRGMPKYRQIMDIVARRIENGTYKLDEPIPSERKLAREFDTNHETANKAIANLVAEGALYRRRGIGTFVASREGESAADHSAPTFPDIDRARRVDIVTYKHMNELFESNSFHEEIMFTIQNMLISSGHVSQIIPAKDVSDFSNYLSSVQGVIATRHLPLRLLRAVVEHEKPLICLNFEFSAPRSRRLIVENTGIDGLIEHLVDLGQREMGFVKTKSLNVFHESRAIRFLRHMEILELPRNLERVYSVDPYNDDDMAKLVHSLRDCSAVMAADDLVAVRLRSALMRFGLRVPEDVSLTGYGDLLIAQKIFPQLTTAGVDRTEFCTRIVDEMKTLLSGDVSTKKIFFQSHALIRSSTAAPNPSRLER